MFQLARYIFTRAKQQQLHAPSVSSQCQKGRIEAGRHFGKRSSERCYLRKIGKVYSYNIYSAVWWICIRISRDVTTPLFTVEIYTLGTPFNLSANVQFYSDIERRIDAMKYFVDIYVAIWKIPGEDTRILDEKDLESLCHVCFEFETEFFRKN